MQMIKYLSDFFVGGELRYKAGELYRKTEETILHAIQGHAEEVEVEAEKVESDLIDIEKATAKELKVFLSKLGIEFDQSAKVDELREIAKSATPSE